MITALLTITLFTATPTIPAIPSEERQATIKETPYTEEAAVYDINTNKKRK